MKTAFEILQSKLTIADTSEFRLIHIPEILDAMEEYKAQLPQQDVDKLGNEDVPKLGYDVRELAEEYASKAFEIDAPYANGLFYGFNAGYNKAKETLYTDLINWIDNEILLNPYYKDSARLKEGVTIVKNHIIIKNEIHKRTIS